MAIEVKVGKVPGRITSVVVEEGATVRAALMAAEVSVTDGETLTMNGNPVNQDSRVYSGTILITRKIKGN